MKTGSIKIISFFLLIFLFLIGNPFCFAEEFSIKDIVVHGDINEVRISSVLTGELGNDILEPIKSGIPITFTYYVELYRQRSLYPDKKISSRVIKKTVSYDNLRKEYKLVQGIEKDIKNSTSKDINEAKKWLRELDSVVIADSHQLKYETTYFLKVKAELKSIKFIFPLNYILFFFSYFDKDTDWHRSPVFVIKEPPMG